MYIHTNLHIYIRALMNRCCKIGRPLFKCSTGYLNELMVRLYTIHVMPGDYVVHKDEIPRELCTHTHTHTNTHMYIRILTHVHTHTHTALSRI